MFRILFVFGMLLLGIPAHAADCTTEVKATDTYKDLTSKLTCLNDRINSLEKANVIASSIKNDHSKDVDIFKPGKCLNYTKSERFNISLMIDGEDLKRESLTFCWSDGAVFAIIEQMSEDGIRLKDASGADIVSFNSAFHCVFNRNCILKLDNGTSVNFFTERMLGAGGKNIARLTVKK